MNQPHIPLYIEKYDAINSSSPDITTMKRKRSYGGRHRIFPMTEKYLEYKMEYVWTNKFLSL